MPDEAITTVDPVNRSQREGEVAGVTGAHRTGPSENSEKWSRAMPEDSEGLMRRFLGYWASRDAEAMAACFGEDGVYDNVPNAEPMVGRAAIKAWLDACFNHLTRIDVEILHCAVNGEWILTERVDDHIVGDKHMPLPVMNATRIVDGRITLFRDYYCRRTVVELGMG